MGHADQRSDFCVYPLEVVSVTLLPSDPIVVRWDAIWEPQALMSRIRGQTSVVEVSVAHGVVFVQAFSSATGSERR